MTSRRRGGSIPGWLVAAGLLIVVLLIAGVVAGGRASTSGGSAGHAPPSALPTTAGASVPGIAASGVIADGSASGAEAATPGHVAGASPRSGGRLPGEPDPVLTPGALNPDVTQATIGRTICVAGYSSSIRPPADYTTALKREQIVQYEYADRRLSSYEEDHLIPLSIGGAPRDPRNLWPEPRSAVLPDGAQVGAATKDRFELYLHDRVCSGELALSAAQRAMATDWIGAWERAGRP